MVCCLCKSGNQGAIIYAKRAKNLAYVKVDVLKNMSILRERGTLEEHESLTYPRPFFAAIPKDHVTLSEKEFILREDWLEGLANWKVKPEQEWDIQLGLRISVENGEDI
jgi:hypothetical protein